VRVARSREGACIGLRRCSRRLNKIETRRGDYAPKNDDRVGVHLRRPTLETEIGEEAKRVTDFGVASAVAAGVAEIELSSAPTSSAVGPSEREKHKRPVGFEGQPGVIFSSSGGGI
jgi:hypothetical protein